MADKDLDIYGGGDIDVNAPNQVPNQGGGNGEPIEPPPIEPPTSEPPPIEPPTSEPPPPPTDNNPICIILKEGNYKGEFGQIRNEYDDGTTLVIVLNTNETKIFIKDEYAIVGDIVDYKKLDSRGNIEVLYGEIKHIPTKEEVLIGFNIVRIENNEDGIYQSVNSLDVIRKHSEYPICVILKNGQYKGLFGEVIGVHEGGDTINVITNISTLILNKEEYAIVDDVIDYKHLDKDGNTEVLYGQLYQIPTKQDILSGINVVSIINNSEGTYHTVNSNDIICLHKDGEVPKVPQEKILSNVCNFVWELKSNVVWNFEEYVLGNSIYTAYNNLSLLTYLDTDGLFYFKNEPIAEYGNSLVELDEKLLKAFILALKNNPIYFKEDGYKYFFYDKIGNFLKSLINDNKICFIQDSLIISSISDNKLFITNKLIGGQLNIIIGDNYIELITKDIDLGIYFCNYIHRWTSNEILQEKVTYGDINSEKVQDLLVKPMIGFVNLLK